MVAVTLVCLFHAFTRRGGIILNNVVVVMKVAVLCVFPILAICVLAGVSDSNHAADNLTPKNAFASVHSDLDSYVQGCLAILYAYNGYNQANYVSIALTFRIRTLTMVKVLCEIDRPRKTFVRGIVVAVCIVCVLYMLVNLSYVRDSLLSHTPFKLSSASR